MPSVTHRSCSMKHTPARGPGPRATSCLEPVENHAEKGLSKYIFRPLAIFARCGVPIFGKLSHFKVRKQFVRMFSGKIKQLTRQTLNCFEYICCFKAGHESLFRQNSFLASYVVQFCICANSKYFQALMISGKTYTG